MLESEDEWLKNLTIIPLEMKPILLVSMYCDCKLTITITKNNYEGEKHI